VAPVVAARSGTPAGRMGFAVAGSRTALAAFRLVPVVVVAVVVVGGSPENNTARRASFHRIRAPCPLTQRTLAFGIPETCKKGALLVVGVVAVVVAVGVAVVVVVRIGSGVAVVVGAETGFGVAVVVGVETGFVEDWSFEEKGDS